jgi:hypothetical protein
MTVPRPPLLWWRTFPVTAAPATTVPATTTLALTATPIQTLPERLKPVNKFAPFEPLDSYARLPNTISGSRAALYE